MAGTAVLVLGDQLSRRNAALEAHPTARVVMVEGLDAADRPYHAHKLVLVWSAMRHRRDELRRAGRDVAYVEAAASVAAGLRGWIDDERRAGRPVEGIAVLEPAERESAALDGLDALSAPITRIEDDRWLGSAADLGVSGDDVERQMRAATQERFYRRVRQRHGALLEADGGPIGGRWNLDRENRRGARDLRRALAAGRLRPGSVPRTPPDSTTGAVIELVAAQSGGPRMGDARTFAWPVTRRAALAGWRGFLADRLAGFGPWEDAMLDDAPVLFHAALSPALNLGLLDPADLVADVEAAWRERRGTKAEIPLSSAEGFVRQVLGWREYMRAVWTLLADGYADRNALGADRPLPEAYWTGETDLRCLSTTVDRVRDRGWTHHIERLMVQGNVAALAGTRPREISDWFRYAYVDGYDWVTHPNVVGMSQHADGGLVATKPYVSGGAYVNRMSDFCGPCRYDPRKRTGPDACPLTTLYWDYLDRNRDALGANRRLAMPYRSLARMAPSEIAAVRGRAREVLDGPALRPMTPAWWTPKRAAA